jgi:hypothetical protein
MCIGLHVKFLLLLSPFNENCNILTNCSENPNMKFLNSSSNLSCNFPCGLKNGQIQRDKEASCHYLLRKCLKNEKFINKY